MSLYSLNKDMLIQLILERDNFEKLNDEEIIEKRKELKAILLKRKAEKLDSNVEHKEFIQKYREYFLSVLVSEKDVKHTYFNSDRVVKIKLNIGKIKIYYRKGIIIYITYIESEEGEIQEIHIRDISNDLENYNKKYDFIDFLRSSKIFQKNNKISP